MQEPTILEMVESQTTVGFQTVITQQTNVKKVNTYLDVVEPAKEPVFHV